MAQCKVCKQSSPYHKMDCPNSSEMAVTTKKELAQYEAQSGRIKDLEEDLKGTISPECYDSICAQLEEAEKVVRAAEMLWKRLEDVEEEVVYDSDHIAPEFALILCEVIDELWSEKDALEVVLTEWEKGRR